MRMALRYHKRINLGKGVGVNVSDSGLSGSVRTKMGSIGTRGFTLKTGIPGLRYSAAWAKSPPGLIILFALMALTGIVLVIYNLVRLIIYLVARLYDFVSSRVVRW
jgi:hypothetical protein